MPVVNFHLELVGVLVIDVLMALLWFAWRCYRPAVVLPYGGSSVSLLGFVLGET